MVANIDDNKNVILLDKRHLSKLDNHLYNIKLYINKSLKLWYESELIYNLYSSNDAKLLKENDVNNFYNSSVRDINNNLSSSCNLEDNYLLNSDHIKVNFPEKNTEIIVDFIKDVDSSDSYDSGVECNKSNTSSSENLNLNDVLINHTEIETIAKLLWTSYFPDNQHKNFLPKQFNVLLTSDQINAHVELYGLKAIVSENPIDKTIYFSFAGTNLKEYKDLLDDISIIRGIAPEHKIKATQYLIKYVIENVIGIEKFLDCSIIFCGHSLGGIIAEIGSLLTCQLILEYTGERSNNIKTITIENPGSSLIISNLFNKGTFPKLSIDIIKDLSQNSFTYNSRHNIVNSWGEQFADNIFLHLLRNDLEEKVLISCNQEENFLISLFKSIITNNELLKFTNLFYHNLSCINTIINKCSMMYKIVTNFFHDHSLTNYLDVKAGIFIPVEKFNGPNKQIILNKDLLNYLNKTKNHYNNDHNLIKKIVIIDDSKEIESGLDTDSSAYNLIDMHEYSYKELIGQLNDSYEQFI